MKRIPGNAAVLLTSLTVSLLAAEFIARTFLDPVDYLNPTIVEDEFLRHRVAGNTGGHDAWGFRNREVPGNTDIVCIGDSMTYGVSARARESWPAALATMQRVNVYNMALGGYGPIQYLYLLRTRAVELHPKIVIVGLYLGNDLLDAYSMVRFNSNWSAYQTGDTLDLPPQVVSPRPSAGKFLGGIRDWLSRTSVVYVLVTQLPLFDFIRVGEGQADGDSDTRIAFRDDKHYVYFYLNSRLRALDLTDPRVSAGLEITKHALKDMKQDTERNHVRLIVAVIPTKQRVYRDLLDQADHSMTSSDRRAGVLASALRDEDTVRGLIVGFLRAQHIEVVDLLPALSSEVPKKDLYPITDGHPNSAGYRVIAGSIDHYLREPFPVVQ